MQTRTPRTTVPAELNSPRAKLVFLYLSTHGASTVADLEDGLGMRKMTLFSILGTLEERGLVERSTETYTAVGA
jgi:DNA-binding MarR family transcriptional regulator